MFELNMHFKDEMIGTWQRFQRNVELSGTSNLVKFKVIDY